MPSHAISPVADASENHYWRYHHLDALLACKQPLTASQDEDLFIAVHQICELAFHQMIVDMDRALAAFGVALAAPADGVIGDSGEITYFLCRIVRLYDTVAGVVPVLSTMRAFAEFRQRIGPGSGFQSYQFRHLEIMSGIERAYWQGGTRDRSGKTHAAEAALERSYGASIAAWFGHHRAHNLRVYVEELARRAPGETPSERRAFLEAHPHAAPLVELLRTYDQAQLRFHRVHLELAVQQLEKIGATYGTGGTSFRDYLAKYEREHAPLFSALA